MNRTTENCIIKNSFHQSHEIIMKVVREGDTVIDATAGNGGDTLFLAELIGQAGKVYSFDIQQQALDMTQQKLKAAMMEDRVILVHAGHEQMKSFVPGPVSAVMFNLGYLPGGDHSVGTKASTTIQALQSAMDLIRVNGLIAMVIYYGRESGFDERDQILEYISTIDCRRYAVSRTEFVNQINCPPILVLIEKLK